MRRMIEAATKLPLYEALGLGPNVAWTPGRSREFVYSQVPTFFPPWEMAPEFIWRAYIDGEQVTLDQASELLRRMESCRCAAAPGHPWRAEWAGEEASLRVEGEIAPSEVSP